MAGRPRLLIVDDEPDMAEFVGDVAEDMGFDPVLAFTAQDCLKLAAEAPPVAMVMDVVMPNMDGVELVRALGGIATGLPVVVMSGYQPFYTDMVDALANSNGLIVAGRLTKPFTADQLEDALKPILESVS